jgi:hypothetical protein
MKRKRTESRISCNLQYASQRVCRFCEASCVCKYGIVICQNCAEYVTVCYKCMKNDFCDICEEARVIEKQEKSP